jgi:uncharacterized protein
MAATFEIKRARGGKYVFNLKSTNDQVILTSQTYESKDSAGAGIESVRHNARRDERYIEKSGSNGLPYFVLIAANNRVIGKSQLYSNRAAMSRGMAAVKKHSRIAATADSSIRWRAAGAEKARGAA